MARQPKVIPFAETMPSDDFQVEQINDDEVLIGRWLDESVQFTAQKAYNDGLGGIFTMVETGEAPYSLIDKRTGRR